MRPGYVQQQRTIAEGQAAPAAQPAAGAADAGADGRAGAGGADAGQVVAGTGGGLHTLAAAAVGNADAGADGRTDAGRDSGSADAGKMDAGTCGGLHPSAAAGVGNADAGADGRADAGRDAGGADAGTGAGLQPSAATSPSASQTPFVRPLLGPLLQIEAILRQVNLCHFRQQDCCCKGFPVEKCWTVAMPVSSSCS